MFESGENAAKIVEKKGLIQISDSNEILELVNAVISENETKVIEYRGGKDKLFGFFVGQVMKRSQGKANPKIVNDLLREKLGQ
jgi:aspartyl-tRNA(Asn)/glutamyl-tRNA(Gln) amidotransferase subunit B